MCLSVNRWRHSHGYGVHSPRAFELVENVLRCPYDYYGYYDIDCALEEEPHSPSLKRYARLLLRLVVRMQPERITLKTDNYKIFAAAAKAADSRTPVTRHLSHSAAREVIYIDSGISAEEEVILAKKLQRPGITLFVRNIPRDLKERLRICINGGIVFYSPKAMLLITIDGMPRMEYSVGI